MVDKVKIYTAFDPPPSAPSEIRCTAEEDKCVRGGEELTDLNIMLRRLRTTDAVPIFGGADRAFYGDVAEVGDYQHALEVVRAAEDAFRAQPVELRARFENNAELFVDFVTDPANVKEMQDLGLIAAPKAPVEPSSSSAAPKG